MTNDKLKEAMKSEQVRNEHILNAGIQIILIVIAISNAYSSFNCNLMARKRDFKLLETAGMTEKQMQKMLFAEVRILFARLLMIYLFVFLLAIFIKAYRSSFEFIFVVKKLNLNLNYLPVIMIFLLIF